MNNINDYLIAAVEMAQEGGKVLINYWGKLSDIREKQFTGDLVTEADKESEHVILDLIRERYPTHVILSEESGLFSVEGSEFQWVVDPLDGTTNYTHQYPMVSISIALLFQGSPIVGVVYNPILNELFQAAKGHGTTFNQQKVHVSEVSKLEKGLLATGFAYDRRETIDTNYAEFCHLTNLTHGVRRGGSAAIDLAYVAAGRLDGFWERGLRPWDMAAGALLVEEAGGRVTNYELDPFVLESGKILASNGKIHEAISRELLHIRRK